MEQSILCDIVCNAGKVTDTFQKPYVRNWALQHHYIIFNNFDLNYLKLKDAFSHASIYTPKAKVVDDVVDWVELNNGPFLAALAPSERETSTVEYQ